MNLYCSILMILSIFLDSVSTEIPEIVQFEVRVEHSHSVQVNLHPVESSLANKNVPVWSPHERFHVLLELVDHVMADVGPFTVYRDPKTCATAVYYHRRQTFHGIIGHHHVIDNLQYNPETRSVVPTSKTVFESSMPKHKEVLPDGELNYEMDGDEPLEWQKSLLPFPHTVYIEILVIVNHDIAEKLHDYTAIASYVITFLNNVEMLFSEIKKPRIKLNVAGIIIGTNRESFPTLVSACYKQSSYQKEMMHATCILDAMEDTLQEYESIPPHSYDVAIFLTGTELFRMVTATSESGESETILRKVGGVARDPNPSYNYGQAKKDRTIAIISTEHYFGTTRIGAHEIAHMFGASHEGGPFFRLDNGMCAAHLMKSNDDICKRCFKFDGKTPGEIEKFFSSRQACIFHNKPRSLHLPNPKLFWNEEDQCRCYGFPKASINQPHHASSHAVNCKSRLQCIAKDHQSHHTGIFMDGTPCDSEKIGTKVCWNTECLPLPHDPEVGFANLRLR